MIDAIFFDLFETLITEFEPNWEPTPGPEAAFGVSKDDFKRAWHARHDARMTGIFPDYPSVLRDIGQALNRPLTEQAIEQLCDTRIKKKRRAFDTACEMVGTLRLVRATGMRIGLISNCAMEEVLAWPDCDLVPLFDDVIFSFEVGFAKPDPEIYKLACKRLGVAPTRALFVGDGGSRELAGARAAGLIPYHATWFVRRWPGWEKTMQARTAEGPYPDLSTPEALVDTVRRHMRGLA